MQPIDPRQFESALAVCASEPIHEIGAIQPHGQLIAFELEAPHRIRYATPPRLIRVADASDRLLGRPLGDILCAAAVEEVLRLVGIARTRKTASGRLTAEDHGLDDDLLVHVYGANGLGVVEFEEDSDIAEKARLADLLLEAQTSIMATDENLGLAPYLDEVAKAIRELTGYDSVMVYLFDPEWNGEVVAQQRSAHAPSFLGIHFPASDIPAQARRLYTLNLVRVVADIGDAPLPIEQDATEDDRAPLDLTYSAQRSLSPIHIEYMRNMGVQATLTLSLLHGGQLCGLITCHHMTAKRIPMQVRQAAVAISVIVSARLASMQATRQGALTTNAFLVITRFLRSLSNPDIEGVVGDLLPQLQSLLDATGVLVVVEGKRYLAGITPASHDVDQLLAWLRTKPPNTQFDTDCLGAQFAPAQSYAERASGLLCTPPGGTMHNAIVWFRAEKVRTVRWGGNYQDGLVRDAAGDYRLTPRKSFEIWTQTWRGRSQPWSDVERGVAAVLALSLPDSLARKSELEASLARRRQAEEELRRQRDTLEDAVRVRTQALSVAKEMAESANRAKSTFLATMSHELRTPLNGIMGMTRLAKRRTTDPTTTEYLSKSDIASRHLLAIIDDILDLSKIEAGRLTLESVDFRLGEVLDKVETIMQPRAAENALRLQMRADAELLETWLRGAPLRLQQVLINLVGNAVKFTSAGTIGISASKEAEDRSGLRLRFEVRDEGIGIAERDQVRIFDAFEQASSAMTREYGGTGLGLAICKRLVTMMGGTIGVHSAPGAGSTFWFDVCMAPSPAASHFDRNAEAAPLDESVKALHAGKRILVAEDDPINQEIVADLMRSAFLRFDLASDGAEAIDLCARHDYALVFMDMHMQRLDGIAATQAIRNAKDRPQMPIIAMTANAFEDDRRRCLAAGMNDFLSKPFEPDQFYAALLRWLPRA